MTILAGAISLAILIAIRWAEWKFITRPALVKLVRAELSAQTSPVKGAHLTLVKSVPNYTPGILS